jgi:predicted N-formylglutamate amidohydrolase
MTYFPYLIDGQHRQSPWLITCDHATNVVPPEIAGGNLGLPAADMERHIAYDPGAWGLARSIAATLGAPVIGGNFSRLVIDPNRGEDDPTLIMQLYDGSIIPANRSVDSKERERRLNLLHRPYHDTLAGFIRPDVTVVSVHSFTPQLRGRPLRPWEVGVLYGEDDRFARPFIDALTAAGDLTVGDNQPYVGYLPGDAIDRHATANGLLNVLIELRNDLIETDEQQASWGDRLAPLLHAAREKALSKA